MKITNLSIQPMVVAPGEDIRVAFTVEREPGDLFNDELTVAFSGYVGTIYRSAFSIGVGKKKEVSFLYKMVVSEGQNLYSYLQDHRSYSETEIHFQFGSFGSVSSSEIEFIVLDSRYSPKIKTLEFERCLNGALNDEGEELRMEIEIAASQTAKAANMTLKLCFGNGEWPDMSDSGIDLSSMIQPLMANPAPVEKMLDDVFSKASDWYLILWFGDAYEVSEVKRIVPHAFINLHLSGTTTGGVCMGGFSKSIEGAPMFESYYPTYLYKGIEQIGDGWTYLTPVNGSTPGDYGGGALRCRRIENKCIIAGSVKIQPGASVVQIADLPDGYAPQSAVYNFTACGGARIARIFVSGTRLNLSWVRNLADGEIFSSSETWVQCSMEYWVD